MARLGTEFTSASWDCLCTAGTFASLMLESGWLTFSGLSWKSPSLNPHTQFSELQYTHIFLCFLQLCFLLLHSHDEHLPHFIFLLLEFTQEFVPLCFISLLKTVTNTEKTVRAVFPAQSWVSSLWWSYCTHCLVTKLNLRSPTTTEMWTPPPKPVVAC